MKKNILLAVLFFCFTAGICLPSFAQNTKGDNDSQHTAKLQDIKKLMDVTGSAKLGPAILNQVLTQFKSISPNVPDKVWDEITQETNTDELVDTMVPIYDKYLTDDEVKGLVAFYQSPLGQKLVNVMPEISKEEMAAGRAWGLQLVQKVETKLKSEGYDQQQQTQTPQK